MKYFEAKFSNGETAYFACIAAEQRPDPDKITLAFPNLVAAFVAPCVRVRQIGLHTANMIYDEVYNLDE